MPLASGKSDKTVARNIAEVLRGYKKTGKIGNIKKVSSNKKAQKIAVAISMKKAGRAKKK